MADVIDMGPDERYTLKRLPALLDEYGIARTGVVHVGAHLGEEVSVYDECGFHRVILVEPDIERLDAIRHRYPTVETVHAACAEQEGVAQLWRGPRTYQDGLTAVPGAERGPMVRTVPLAAIQADCNVAVIDTQGTELEVLQSADLDRLDLVVIETIAAGYTLPAANREAVGLWFVEFGWYAVQDWRHDSTGHTDTVFVRRVPRD